MSKTNLEFQRDIGRSIERLILSESGIRYETRRKLYEFEWTQVEALERYLNDSEGGTWYSHNILMKNDKKISLDFFGEIKEITDYIRSHINIPVRNFHTAFFGYKLSATVEKHRNDWNIFGRWSPFGLIFNLILGWLTEKEYELILKINNGLHIINKQGETIELIRVGDKKNISFRCSCNYQKLPIIGNKSCIHIHALWEYIDCILNYGRSLEDYRDWTLLPTMKN